MLVHLNKQPISPKRVVILGAKGFVASHIALNLRTAGINVLALSKNEVDLLSDQGSAKLLEYLQPNDALVIVSAIAPCKTTETLLQNIRMIQAVEMALSKIALSHVVYISSDAVYADSVSLTTEDSMVQPSSLHGMMHAVRELMLKLALGDKTPLAILRPSLLYGMEDPHNGYGPNRFRRLVLENKPITMFGEGEEKRDHIYIKDVAAIVNLVLCHRSSGVLNIATGESISFRNTAEYIYKHLDEKPNIQGTARQNPVTHKYFDIAACYKAFPEFHYHSYQEGIAKVLASVKESANG